MHEGGFFFQALVYLAAAVISVPIAKRLGLGSVLGYLIAGVAIGPFALGLVGKEGRDVMHFAEFGVVMMLFLIGLELRPALLWRLRGPILGMGGIQVGATAALIAGIAAVLGLPWQSSVALGMILALSSTAIVLQTLAEKNLFKTHGGQSAFSVLLFQDMAVIPMLAVLPLLALAPVAGGGAAQHASLVKDLPGWAQTLVVLGSVVTIVIAGRYGIRPVFRFIAKANLREVFTAAALLLVVGIAILMTLVGLSPALGTFVAGVVLANSEYRHQLEGDIEPFKGLLMGLFFIAVGASINFGLVAENPGLIAALVAALVLGKLVILFILGRAFRMGLDQNLLFAFSLAQGGEFGFVLFAFAEKNRVLPPELVAIMVVVVALTMALTPLLMLINERLLLPRLGTLESADRPADEIDHESRVIIAGFGRFGNVVGRFLRANGIWPVVLDLDSDNVEILRKIGLQVFYGDATRLDLLRAAGAAEARLLIVALDEPEKTRELIETARKHFPNLTIMARAHSRVDAYELLNEGLEHVYRETLDTSLRVGVDALKIPGHRSFAAHRSSLLFRCHDEDVLRDLVKLRHDHKSYLSHARQRIRDLEEAIAEEQTRGDKFRDEGWDTESLREDYRQAIEQAETCDRSGD